MDADDFENFVSIIDHTINTKRKKHIIGGVLLSISMLFGGLAFTVMTLKMEETSYGLRS